MSPFSAADRFSAFFAKIGGGQPGYRGSGSAPQLQPAPGGIAFIPAPALQLSTNTSPSLSPSSTPPLSHDALLRSQSDTHRLNHSYSPAPSRPQPLLAPPSPAYALMSRDDANAPSALIRASTGPSGTHGRAEEVDESGAHTSSHPTVDVSTPAGASASALTSPVAGQQNGHSPAASAASPFSSYLSSLPAPPPPSLSPSSLSFLSRGIGTWTAEDVWVWLHYIKLPAYPLFHHRHIDGDMLLDMTDADLQTEMGVEDKFHRGKILKRIREHQGSDGAMDERSERRGRENDRDRDWKAAAARSSSAHRDRGGHRHKTWQQPHPTRASSQQQQSSAEHPPHAERIIPRASPTVSTSRSSNDERDRYDYYVLNYEVVAALKDREELERWEQKVSGEGAAEGEDRLDEDDKRFAAGGGGGRGEGRSRRSERLERRRVLEDGGDDGGVVRGGRGGKGFSLDDDSSPFSSSGSDDEAEEEEREQRKRERQRRRLHRRSHDRHQTSSPFQTQVNRSHLPPASAAGSSPLSHPLDAGADDEKKDASKSASSSQPENSELLQTVSATFAALTLPGPAGLTPSPSHPQLPGRSKPSSLYPPSQPVHPSLSDNTLSSSLLSASSSSSPAASHSLSSSSSHSPLPPGHGHFNSQQSQHHSASSLPALPSSSSCPPVPSRISRLASTLTTHPTFIDEVTNLSILNEGVAGHAYLGSYHSLPVVVKLPKSLEISGQEWREWQAHLRLPPHRHLVEFLGALVMEETNYLVTKEVRQGSLKSVLQRGGEGRRLYGSGYAVLRAALEIGRGLSHLHAHRIVHRDISSRNILVDSDGTFIIADLGLCRDMARQLSDAAAGSHPSHTEDAYEMGRSTAIPVRWTAPESLLTHSYSSKSDVWSLGVTLWEMASGGAVPYSAQVPYSAVEANRRVIREVVSGEATLEVEEDWEPQLQVGQRARRVIALCLRRDVSQRPNSVQLVEELEREMADWEREGGEEVSAVKQEWADWHRVLEERLSRERSEEEQELRQQEYEQQQRDRAALTGNSAVTAPPAIAQSS